MVQVADESECDGQRCRDQLRMQPIRPSHSQVLGYNQLVDHVGIQGKRRLTEAMNKDSLVRQKEYPTESSSKSRESNI
ncbi:hypothetical protein Taro_048131 [Colocasia esculenta]|uniref:Uncharacterized protein n=1 Tax=Colocasia esculenta TaxID=4460 RepID=A0A843X843_COLES|nr:hypothetical protein [Colocasia esculenta]